MSGQTEFVRPAREQVVEQNMGLVHACAHRYKGRGVEYEDLVQAGCIGLIKAADLFDYSRGLRFSTYAVCLILGEMRRLFRDGGAEGQPKPQGALAEGGTPARPLLGRKRARADGRRACRGARRA